MDLDDETPKAPKGALVGDDLSGLSVAELEGRLELLEAEMARVRREISAKQSSRAAAADVFKN